MVKSKRIKINAEKGIPIPQKDVAESNARIKKEMKQFLRNLRKKYNEK